MSKATSHNKMFLQWCREELVLSFIFVPRLVSWDKTRLRKGTTAETQTLYNMRLSVYADRSSIKEMQTKWKWIRIIE
jgi:hypothetical protein